MDKKHMMIGRTIRGLQIADDRQALRFDTEQGEVVVRADGDCCSVSWVENVDLPALGFPAKVLAVEDVEMPDLGSPSEYDCIAYYGCKITTDRGDLLIDYRNSSNGYYGGSLEWPNDRYYGGVYGQNESKQNWVELSDAPAFSHD